MHKGELKEKTIRVVKYVRQVDVPTRAASVSYFAMLASIPLLAVILTLAAQMLPDMSVSQSQGGTHITTQELNTALARLLPAEANAIIKNEIARIQSEPPVGLLSIGLLLAWWTSSNAYMALINAMNEIYGIRETRSTWQVRLTALLMPLIFATMLVLALASMVAAPAIIKFLELGAFGGMLMTIVQFAALFGIVMLSFEANYRAGPMRDRIKSHKISTGSITGATIFLIASIGFQYYVQHFGSYDKVYGSLGGAIIFLVWIWMLSACLLVGCAVNRALLDVEQAQRTAEFRDLYIRSGT